MENINIPNGWKFLGKPRDGLLFNKEMNWHAIVYDNPPFYSIVVIDESSNPVGEVDSLNELP
jgi:hypothetical protein